MYFADLTRKEEQQLPPVHHPIRKILGIGKSNEKQAQAITELHLTDPQDSTSNSAPAVSQEEWAHAARSLRTATWSAVFYLITTDVLGPGSVPWSLSQMGFGPGIVLYTLFGALAV
jgi:hypothetical protein